MKKKTKIALITVVSLAVLTAVGVMIYQGTTPDMSKLVAIENKEESKEPEVVIDIRTEREKAPEYKEIVDEETGDKVMAEVQINEPIEQKPTTPPEKPKSEGSYTNPEQPPTYTKEQTVIEEKPKNKTSKPKETKKKEKVTLWKALRSNFFMLGLAFKASPSRVIGQFTARISRDIRGLYFGIIFYIK